VRRRRRPLGECNDVPRSRGGCTRHAAYTRRLLQRATDEGVAFTTVHPSRAPLLPRGAACGAGWDRRRSCREGRGAPPPAPLPKKRAACVSVSWALRCCQPSGDPDRRQTRHSTVRQPHGCDPLFRTANGTVAICSFIDQVNGGRDGGPPAPALSTVLGRRCSRVMPRKYMVLGVTVTNVDTAWVQARLSG
jgi:hypothetical protein